MDLCHNRRALYGLTSRPAAEVTRPEERPAIRNADMAQYDKEAILRVSQKHL